MDRSLVQAKQQRSGAGASGRVVQGTVKTAVHAHCTGLVRHASGRLRPWRAPEQAQFRAGYIGRPPCSINSFAQAWRGNADPIAALTLPVCPRESDATADRVRNRLTACLSQPASTTNHQKELQQVSNEETAEKPKAQAMAIRAAKKAGKKAGKKAAKKAGRKAAPKKAGRKAAAKERSQDRRTQGCRQEEGRGQEEGRSPEEGWRKEEGRCEEGCRQEDRAQGWRT